MHNRTTRLKFQVRHYSSTVSGVFRWGFGGSTPTLNVFFFKWITMFWNRNWAKSNIFPRHRILYTPLSTTVVTRIQCVQLIGHFSRTWRGEEVGGAKVTAVSLELMFYFILFYFKNKPDKLCYHVALERIEKLSEKRIISSFKRTRRFYNCVYVGTTNTTLREFVRYIVSIQIP